MLGVGLVVSMVNGSLWYNPKTFFPAWWHVVGAGKENPGTENMGMLWGFTMLAALLKAYFIGVAMNAFAPVMGGFSFGTGLEVGFLLWFGAIVPSYLVNKLFAGHGFKVFAIEVGNHLVDFLILGAVYGIWH